MRTCSRNGTWNRLVPPPPLMYGSFPFFSIPKLSKIERRNNKIIIWNVSFFNFILFLFFALPLIILGSSKLQVFYVYCFNTPHMRLSYRSSFVPYILHPMEGSIWIIRNHFIDPIWCPLSSPGNPHMPLVILCIRTRGVTKCLKSTKGPVTMPTIIVLGWKVESNDERIILSIE